VFDSQFLRPIANALCRRLSPNRGANDRALREAFDRLDIPHAEHAAAVNAISLPHSVIFRDPHDHGSILCLPYALGLHESDVHFNRPMTDLRLTHQRRRWAARLIGARFAAFLLEGGRLKRTCLPKAGRLIMYFENDQWRHAGVVTARDRVISKWGEQPVYEHPTWQVPWRYGLVAQYYERPSLAEAIRLFEEHEADLGQTETPPT
jgi:hypothetical protein